MGIGELAALAALLLSVAALFILRATHRRHDRHVRDLALQFASAQAAAHNTEGRLRLLLSQVPALLWTVDTEKRVTSLSGAGVLGHPVQEESLLGKSVDMLMLGAEHRTAAAGALERALLGETVRFESQENGRWLQSDLEPLRGKQGEVVGALGVVLDVTQERANAERFANLARQDALTELPNRLALDEALPPMLARARTNRESVAALFVDLDRFKSINDTLGHRAGDELLKLAAARFKLRLGPNVTVYRPGGDEFVIVMEGIRHKRTVASLAMDMLSIFADPFEIDGRELFVTASVGASIFPANAQNSEELIAFADSAMYRAKESGRNNAKFYDGTMHAHVLERMGLEQDLRQALARGELRLLYQPIIDVVSERVIGAEALLRWHHPLLGELLPGTFIPIAEETGIVVEISRWVLREVCACAAKLRTEFPDFRVAVNVSPRDFYEADFASALGGILAHAGLPAAALDLEITENVMLNTLALGTLARVNGIGVKIVVDDFGMGYSSLAYLKKLTVDALKIDKIFIDDVTRDPYDQGIVRAISTLAQTLKLRVVCEGIETQAQLEFMRSVRCDHAQGYLFYAPLRWKDLVEIVKKAPAQSRPAADVIPLYGAKGQVPAP